MKKVILIALCVAAAAATYVNWDAISHELLALRLIPQEERFTELYFDQYPTATEHAGLQRISFTFAIHNKEGATVTYPYTVYGEANDQILISSSATTTVGADETAVIPVSLNFPYGSRRRVVIELTKLGQRISFWLSSGQ